MSVGYASHRGRVREQNEDGYCILVQPALAAGIDTLLAVADGMGGHQAGEVASGHTVAALAEAFSTPEYQRNVDYSPQHNDYWIAVLKAVIERINDDLVKLSDRQPTLRGMGTTVTVALLAQGQCFFAHVGDSRAYLWREGKFVQLTQDHSWVAEQVRNGQLDEGEARTHPSKNVLTRCLGAGAPVRVDRFVQPVHAGDVFLLCTDGLSNMVQDNELAQIVAASTAPQQACDRLVDLSNERGGLDNITVLVARVLAQPVPSTVPGGRVLGLASAQPRAAVTEKIVLQPMVRARTGQSGRTMGWLRIVLSLGPGVLAGALAFVALHSAFGAPSPLLISIGAAGFGLAVASLCWLVWTWLHGRKL
jgi:PPM family protein phosphatase